MSWQRARYKSDEGEQVRGGGARTSGMFHGLVDRQALSTWDAVANSDSTSSAPRGGGGSGISSLRPGADVVFDELPRPRGESDLSGLGVPVSNCDCHKPLAYTNSSGLMFTPCAHQPPQSTASTAVPAPGGWKWAVPRGWASGAASYTRRTCRCGRQASTLAAPRSPPPARTAG